MLNFILKSTVFSIVLTAVSYLFAIFAMPIMVKKSTMMLSDLDTEMMNDWDPNRVKTHSPN